MSQKETLLSIRNLNVVFHTQRGLVRAVRDLSFDIEAGKTLAVVGESGCGKSVTAHSINQLIPQPPGEITGGEIFFKGQNLLTLSATEIEALRGTQISMIFQEPMSSLNPVLKIGWQIADVFIRHQKIKKKEAFFKAVELLDLVRLPSPAKRALQYPHQLSGGMRQRVMIAMALASPQPGLLIADEPTTALDVSIQAQILDLLKDLQEKIQMSLLLITHDMGVVAQTADRVVVMYAGRKVEEADVFSLFQNPRHPYTKGLLNSMPAQHTDEDRLKAIEGTVPELRGLGEGCPFENRCSWASKACSQSFPTASKLEGEHRVWCHNLEESS